MKVNPRVFEERMDMLNGIQIPNCQPKELRVVAEHIMDMVTALDYSVGDYNSVTELDKKITVDYWRQYDNLLEQFVNTSLSWNHFKEWYTKATDVSTIERAMRWLTSHNYLLLKPDVLKRAQEAASKYSNAIRGG